jgi:putative transposase
MLIEFMAEPDPLYAMLEWLTNELMKLEAENKVGAHKGEHCPTRTTHFSGTRVRRFDTRLGTIYLLVPKLRKGGYIPFFCDRKETLGASPPPGGSRSLHQWCLHPKDGAPCSKLRD